MSDDSNSFSQKGQRHMTDFFGQELLYDYMTLNLDPERMSAMDQFVKESRPLQEEIQKMNDALNYCEHLSETVVADFLVDKIKTPTTYFHIMLQKLRIQEWPSSLRLGVEISLVSILIVLIALFIPWHRISNLQFSDMREVVITEVSRDYEKGMGPESEVGQQPGVELPLYQDEVVSNAPAVSTTVQAMSPTTTVKSVLVTTTSVMAQQAAATVTTLAEAEKQTQGFLYRGEISVANVSATTTKLVEKMSALGGRKAGDVPLGWKKGSGSYFHFTIPEKQFETMKESFNQFGNLKINKEKHPRVMPQGLIRIIITVNESSGPK